METEIPLRKKGPLKNKGGKIRPQCELENLKE